MVVPPESHAGAPREAETEEPQETRSGGGDALPLDPAMRKRVATGEVGTLTPPLLGASLSVGGGAAGHAATGMGSPHSVPPQPNTGGGLANPLLQASNTESSLATAAESARGPDLDWPLALVGGHTLLRPEALRDAKAMLARLETDFQDAETRLAEECQKLADGWRRLSVAVEMARCQNKRARAQGEKDAAEAEGVRARALQEVEAAVAHREEAEARLKEF